jgi:hypothetical protein
VSLHPAALLAFRELRDASRRFRDFTEYGFPM